MIAPEIYDILAKIDVRHYLVLSILLFCIGLCGVLLRRSLLSVLMSVLIMINSVNINFLAFAQKEHSSTKGHMFAFFVIVVAAAETLVGLILLASYRREGKKVLKW
ncbi:MAG: NADH-quinone oxidoreductase subunit NuoK [Acidobacteriota bacterium]|nr:NADH-quinone oxidoreductase subunit NuoK [Blastocatellia bacterium]MDW8412089.1 NADH-quinone oxidoreductase subunit NuoK [Acidobacteriota bacterium]